MTPLLGSHEFSARGPAAPPKRVLVVDDDPDTRRALERILTTFGYVVDLAADGEEGLERLGPEHALVILDAVMPGIDGFEVTRRIRADLRYLNLPIVMVTGLHSREERLRAVEVGVHDFLAKPFDVAELKLRTGWLLRMKEATDAIEQHRAELEIAVRRRTADLERALSETAAANERAAEAHLDTIRRLVLAAEYKDHATAEHIERIGLYCELIARTLGLPDPEVEVIRQATPMHDVGKLGVPDRILLKPGKLTAEEWEIMKQHTTIGTRILGGSRSPLLQMGEVVALSHHEKWDGSGYPRGLAAEDIPLVGRICAVADVFDALTNDRRYRAALSNEEVYGMMRRDTGRHFDPRVLEAFFQEREQVETIQRELRPPA